MVNDSGKFLEQLQLIAKVKAERDLEGTWFKGSVTYLDALVNEVAEVKEELCLKRQCFLEDELGDLLWNFVCSLEHLELEGRIDKAAVFERVHKKYAERVTKRKDGESWDEVKAQQKQALLLEFNRSQ
ncbi:MazG nucleotide pyrophosphohydrolase domain-containing protein [Enterovibrio sp. FF113]|uniref:MazG nucleotide pyrophosphohydrolase domain-containing protein n=1 Tax=Enterovibrio sp. FF113 TaxID=3230010 RepID=UPI00352E387D